MENTKDLRLLLASRYPLIVAQADDEERFMEILRRAAGMLELPVWRWSATRGLVRDGGEPAYNTIELRRALEFITSLKAPGVFVLADAHPALADAVTVRRVKEMAQSPLPGQTLVITGQGVDVPAELKHEALTWVLEPPSREELEELVSRLIGDMASRNLTVLPDAAGVAALIDAVRGLSLREAERVIREAAHRGALDDDGVAFVRAAKAEMLKGGILELVGSDVGTLDQVGGMDGLKQWLRLRGRALEPAAKQFGLDPPKGVLLTGVPGCGKSLVAKTLARTWDLPLVLLDPARIYGPYVGESEQKLHDALETVEAMAPVVLWVDEIEKGFAAGGMGDSGVSQRILGTFLRWMQDRPQGVFLVATCNDVDSLPPEFLRKGRFDEIFFVDLPGPQERESIFRIQLSRRKRDPASFDLARLARASEGFSGAEIEAGVVGAMYRAYASGRELTTDELVQELAGTAPLSRTRAEDVERLRAWAAGRAVPAT